MTITGNLKEDGRTKRSRQTRARVMSAASELFTTSGYTTTSIGAIAAKAGVSEQIIYYSFGNKRAVLTASLDRAIAGEDDLTPTMERPWVQAALASTDPLKQIRLQVALTGEILLRVAPLLNVVRSAATTDGDLSEVWAANIRERLIAQLDFVEALGRTTPLRVSVESAADIALVLLSPETYHLLVNERGWGVARWQEWAVDALQRALTSLPM